MKPIPSATDQFNVPDDDQVQRRHAHVVHQRDADADDHAADGEAGARSAKRAHREADGGHHRGDRQGDCGQIEVIPKAVSGHVAQHGDEMRGPDAEAGDATGGHQPDAAVVGPGGARPLEHVRGGQAGEQANAGGQQHQPTVVLVLQAIPDSVHHATGTPLPDSAEIGLRFA
jgi:hypothetical protein